MWILRLQNEIKRSREIEQNCKYREEHFKTLFDIAPIFIDSFDTSGHCHLWNKECERVFGWSIEELNAHENVFALFHPDPLQQEIMREAFAARKETQYIEMTPMTKNGELIPSRWVNVNLSDNEIIYIGIDMRAQKEAEKNLLDAQHKLQEVNGFLQDRVEKSIKDIYKKEQILLEQARLVQMGEMLSIIAHQWRQPLSVIDMSAFSIQNKIDLGKFNLDEKASQEKFLHFLQNEIKDIHSYTQYLTGTIEDFTNFFKPNKEKESTLLSIPVEKALNILNTMIIKEGIEVTVDIKTNKSINIYTNEVMQVILNIIKNSIDNFTEKSIPDPKINIRIEEDNNKFTLNICDNGGGIDDAILEKIFDPYFSTKDEKNGTGLGLYISKIVIENHSSGLLNVKNIDNGVCFEIILYGER
ncbi:PAS domain-containing sensor histidine kinase [Sulfurimonas sp. HSL3-2]|uniref:PAS domain-containing sensor histidine kinase n=1 Tax=Hydrocurvibacter mobilis TaxID=3131936 RepID=UPI0031F84785